MRFWLFASSTLRLSDSLRCFLVQHRAGDEPAVLFAADDAAVRAEVAAHGFEAGQAAAVDPLLARRRPSSRSSSVVSMLLSNLPSIDFDSGILPWRISSNVGRTSSSLRPKVQHAPLARRQLVHDARRTCW